MSNTVNTVLSHNEFIEQSVQANMPVREGLSTRQNISAPEPVRFGGSMAPNQRAVYTAQSAAQMGAEAFHELGIYRRKAFVEKLGWNLTVTPEGLELDAFDQANSLYIVARNEAGRIAGCTRLLRTDSPYLLADVFGELIQNVDAPRDPHVWEVSRVTAMDFGDDADTDTGGQAVEGKYSTQIALDIMINSIHRVRDMGGKGLVAVTVIAAERLIRQAGARYHRLGAPKIIDGFPLVAIWIDVNSI